MDLSRIEIYTGSKLHLRGHEWRNIVFPFGNPDIAELLLIFYNILL